MSDPSVTNAPDEGDFTLDPGARQERSRSYTPGIDHKAVANRGFRRVVSRESGPQEAAEAIEDEASAIGLPASWEMPDPAPAGRLGRSAALPTLHRNKAVDLLEAVHEHTDPIALENRLTILVRYAAVALLCGIVLAVLGSIFLFRATRTPAVVPKAVVPRPAPLSEEAIDAEAAASAAAAALRAFLASTTVEERQRLIGFDEPMAPCLEGPGRVPALEKSAFSPKDARPVLLGRQVAVLVPMTDQSGVVRTAALLNHAGHYRIDWRSVMTPESMSWNEFVAAPGDTPRLFRVELEAVSSNDPTGATFSARRPTGDPSQVTLSVDPRSRVGEDLRTGLAKRAGRSLPADVFLQGSPGGPLRIVGWTPDKWEL